MKAASIVYCLILVSITSLPGIAQNQATGMTQQPATQYEAIARPIDWGQKSLRIFKDSNMLINFRLVTSWIPGADREGVFRFRLSAFPKIPASQAEAIHQKNLDTPDGLENFLSHASKCNFGLMLNDSDGFLLRTVPLSFVNIADGENAQVTGIMDNSSDQMNADEYLKFVGSGEAKGTWQVSWRTDCSLAQ
jgi:hypothetical protein